MDELKRCPFCGAEAKTIENEALGWWYIGCSNSSCLMWADTQMVIHTTEAEAIAAWNRRAE